MRPRPCTPYQRGVEWGAEMRTGLVRLGRGREIADLARRITETPAPNVETAERWRGVVDALTSDCDPCDEMTAIGYAVTRVTA